MSNNDVTVKKFFSVRTGNRTERIEPRDPRHLPNPGWVALFQFWILTLRQRLPGQGVGMRQKKAGIQTLTPEFFHYNVVVVTRIANKVGSH